MARETAICHATGRECGYLELQAVILAPKGPSRIARDVVHGNIDAKTIERIKFACSVFSLKKTSK
jgi:hypothetical protein